MRDIRHLAISGRDKAAAGYFEKRVQIWDLQTQKVLGTFDTVLDFVELTPGAFHFIFSEGDASACASESAALGDCSSTSCESAGCASKGHTH